jgi:plastocyanin
MTGASDLRRTLRPFVAAIAIALVLLAMLRVGMAAGDSAAGGGQAGDASASAAPTVRIKNFAFHPGTLTVPKGARVAFVNASGVEHTATRAGGFNKRIAPGTTAFVRFKRPGTYRYHCTIHPFMRGKIVVE